MKQKIIVCSDCKVKIDARDVEEYELCEMCDPQDYLCQECWPTHPCNLDDEELDSMRGEVQVDTWLEER